jgi:hypothetical protein
MDRRRRITGGGVARILRKGRLDGTAGERFATGVRTRAAEPISVGR